MRPFIVSTALMEEGPIAIGTHGATKEPRRAAAHTHPRGQLLGTMTGLSTVGSETGRWVIPPTHAIWLPPRHRHDFASHGPFDGWSVYVEETACASLPDRPRVLRMSALLREAAMRITGWRKNELSAAETRIALVVLDEIAQAPDEPFGLPMPKDPRLARMAEAILADPATWRPLPAQAAAYGLSARTLTRRFPEETGFTFRAWQQRARMTKAMEWLAEGRSVTMIAFDLGYETASSFIDLFKAHFGVTPGRYFEAHRNEP